VTHVLDTDAASESRRPARAPPGLLHSARGGSRTRSAHRGTLTAWHRVHESRSPQPVILNPPNYNRTSTDGHVTVTVENSDVFCTVSAADPDVQRPDRPDHQRPRDANIRDAPGKVWIRQLSHSNWFGNYEAATVRHGSPAGRTASRRARSNAPAGYHFQRSSICQRRATSQPSSRRRPRDGTFVVQHNKLLKQFLWTFV
jgi:hypothetical protein